MSKDLRPKVLPNEDFSHLSEARVSGQSIYEGSFLRIQSDVVISADGYKTSRDYAIHPGAVAVLPFLDTTTLLLERQWRYPLNRSFLEFPAGKIDPGESPIATAQRELLEETGFIAKEWAYLGEFHPVTSYSTEVIFMFMARLLSEKQLPNTDKGECIDLLKLNINEFIKMVENNTISDAKTISMGFWLLRYLNGEYSPQWDKV
jgi:ADP-ribose pyrophosphatase